MVNCYISRNVTFDKDFTPYIHVLVYHASQFHSKFGSLRSFEMEEVEHLNYTNKLVFYGASNRGREDYIAAEQVNFISLM